MGRLVNGRLSLLARADDGGIAAQCYGFFRNLRPEKVLVCHTEHRTRGTAKPGRFSAPWSELRTCRRAPHATDIDWLLDGAHSVLSVECWYGAELPARARRLGVKTVLQPNPEMSGLGEQADVLIAPTYWRMDALPPETIHLPFPTDLDLIPQREFEAPAKVLYHVHSEAMEDRNGTQALLAAVEQMKESCRLYIRGGTPRTETVGKSLVTWLAHYDGWFYEAYPPGIDAIVLPRRYGGLCLPMQEAASMGLPIITTDLQPQRSWVPFVATVPATNTTQVEMRGGTFAVCQPDIPRLAAKLDELVTNPTLCQFLANSSFAWAKQQSWPNWLQDYEEILR